MPKLRANLNRCLDSEWYWNALLAFHAYALGFATAAAIWAR